MLSRAGKDELKRWGCMLGGITLYALGLNLFLAPNNIAAGGIAGIATVLSSLMPVSVATVIFFINLPLLVASVFMKGWKFARNTVLASWMYTGLVYLTDGWPVLTTDLVSASIFGGAVYGAGMALLVLGNASTGGSDLIIRLLVKRFPGVSIGKMALLVESSVVIFAMIGYRSIELGLYAILTLYICAVFADKVLLGTTRGNACMIITGKDPALVAAPLTEQLGCAITRLEGEGMFNDGQRSVLFTAIRVTQTPKLKEVLAEVDAKAFVVVMPANEVVGGTFKTLFLFGRQP